MPTTRARTTRPATPPVRLDPVELPDHYAASPPIAPPETVSARGRSKPQEQAAPKRKGAIVPVNSVAGRALISVIAIMSFLAALALGGVVLVRAAAAEWQSQVAREITIQVRPVAGRNLETEVDRAAQLARGTANVTHVKAMSKEESARLLEPWLGTGLALDDLPVPRMITVTMARGATPDLDRLRRSLGEQVAGASLDDHRGWVDQMRAMTRTAVVAGIGLLGLVMTAAILLIAFATRGAMFANKPIIEVLHFVGAKNQYIAGQFQRHFLALGLKGAGIGCAAAAALFVGMGHIAPRFSGITDQDQVSALFGSLALTPHGYAGIFGLMIVMASVVALTSRLVVHRTLHALE